MCRTIIESCHIPEINYMLIIPQFKKEMNIHRLMELLNKWELNVFKKMKT